MTCDTMMLRPIAVLVAAALASSLGLGACAPKTVKAPTDRKVCYNMQRLKEGGVRFDKVADNVPSLELCAAELEGMRLRFLRLGGTTTNVVGSYQGQFLFLRTEGVFTANSLTAPQYPALVRIGNQLVAPGSVPR